MSDITTKSPKIVEGNLDATGKKFAIIVSRFNHFIVDRLVEGCLDTLARHGCDTSQCTIYRAPGAFEIPHVAKRVSQNAAVDGIIALGAVIRGATPHFEYISAEVTKGLAQVAMSADKPVTYGVITTDTIEQAIERAGTKAGNKGAEAAMAAIEMANLSEKL
ncbi:MAG: 6,7-dimethyl-8-ribityllumazine synthase [Deltaproteobacteria bacterium]|nr:6,7-dimethyl-8-ribityllumazine synthase [Deltaproteobacteria bacterium]MBN2674781.1 6,7-dimethyl-8-ribityllumazine synthase [Deltaproteobacteria bacterium]